MPADILSEVSLRGFAAVSRRSRRHPTLHESSGAKHLETTLTGFGSNTDTVMGAARQSALAASVHDVFEIAAALLFCATIRALFLREIPLRKSNRREVATACRHSARAPQIFSVLTFPD
jgi:hypothetical protein